MSELLLCQRQKHIYEQRDDSPGQTKHDAKIDNAAPCVVFDQANQHHEEENSNGQANRNNLGFLIRMKIAHAKGRR